MRSFLSVSVDMCLHCLHARVCLSDGGQSSDPSLGGSLHSFHYSPADLLCQLHSFTVPLTCPLPCMSLRRILKTLLKKRSSMNAKAGSCRIANKSLLHPFSKSKGDKKGRIGGSMIVKSLHLGVYSNFKSSLKFLPLHGQLLELSVKYAYVLFVSYWVFLRIAHIIYVSFQSHSSVRSPTVQKNICNEVQFHLRAPMKAKLKCSSKQKTTSDMHLWRCIRAGVGSKHTLTKSPVIKMPRIWQHTSCLAS